jgi:iron transport multicopper oxidase
VQPRTFIGGINSAILRYEGAPVAEFTTIQLNSTNPYLHHLENLAAPGIPIPGAADVNLSYDIQFSTTSDLFTVNNATFQEPTIPVLLQIISGAWTPQ